MRIPRNKKKLFREPKPFGDKAVVYPDNAKVTGGLKVRKLGATVDGRSWALRALNPVDDTKGPCRGIPDRSIFPTVMRQFRLTYTLTPNKCG